LRSRATSSGIRQPSEGAVENAAHFVSWGGVVFLALGQGLALIGRHLLTVANKGALFFLIHNRAAHVGGAGKKRGRVVSSPKIMADYGLD
jgi:hypothetical protein